MRNAVKILQKHIIVDANVVEHDLNTSRVLLMATIKAHDEGKFETEAIYLSTVQKLLDRLAYYLKKQIEMGEVESPSHRIN